MPADGHFASTRLVIPSTPIAVRHALHALFETLVTQSFDEHARETAQIVLAEALNNIVEHAYADGPGEIEVTVEVVPAALCCRISDSGRPMPGGQLPLGRVPSACSEAGDDLPEGGFGWHLIRTLADKVEYRREDGRNLLDLRISAKQ